MTEGVQVSLSRVGGWQTPPLFQQLVSVYLSFFTGSLTRLVFTIVGGTPTGTLAHSR